VTETQRRLVADAWAFRTRVEREAAARFIRLATEISRFDPHSPVPALMRRAAEDEHRHAALCAGLAAAYGTAATASANEVPIAPRALGARAAVLYEVVAACCITETESVATLTSLLAEEVDPGVEKVLRAIARDEVVHGRMGWAHLARESAGYDVSFLSSWIPAMLSGSVEETLFSHLDATPEDPDLLRHGVLPPSQKRAIFARTLEEVVVPGLEQFGIDGSPARAWVCARIR
jgi:Rubrerythrin